MSINNANPLHPECPINVCILSGCFIIRAYKTKLKAPKLLVFSAPGRPSVLIIVSLPLNLYPGLGGVHLNTSGYLVT